MIDTAGTLAKAANVLKEMGAKSVRACATHPVLSGPAYERLAESALEEIIVADTIPLSNDPAKDKSKITVLSMSDIFADIIDKVYNYEEISSSFIN
jgi:ribose-phosphate pyrophosphokinase